MTFFAVAGSSATGVGGVQEPRKKKNASMKNSGLILCVLASKVFEKTEIEWKWIVNSL
jgi:hypothetical protein